MSAPDLTGDPLTPARRLGAADGPPGVTLAERAMGLIEVLPFKGRDEAVAAETTRRMAVGARVLAIGPASLLVLADSPLDALEGALRAALGDQAAIVDQSSSRARLVLSGPAARRVLAKSVRLDLAPDVFPPGAAAATLLGQIPAIVIAAEPPGTYELLPPLTYRRAAIEGLIEAALEFGCATAPLSAPSEPVAP